jgi:transcription initiation factor IIE alpha subunit
MTIDIICEHCGSHFDRDQYMNIYGTLCPSCGKKIEGIKSTIFSSYVQEENKKKIEELTKELLNKIRKNICKEQ